MVAIISISDRGQITIPVLLRKALNIQAGKKVLIAKSGKSLVVKPVTGTKDVMQLYASVDPKGKSIDPDVALRKAKAIKARVSHFVL